MKIVFCDVPLRKELDAKHYKVNGNKAIEYDGEVIFPVNAVLAKTMKKGERVKVVLLPKEDIEGNSAINAGYFQKELNDINRGIGAEIEYITMSTAFQETRDTHEALFRKMVEKLEDNAEIIGDVTYGPKPLPIVMFAVMNFAEKFFNADIKHIVYGKVDFIYGSGDDKPETKNPEIFDLTPLYYLNNLTNVMEYKSSEEAVKALDTILDL